MSLTFVFDILIATILRGGLYALMAVGVSLIFGVMNTSNFAHGEFYMFGAYAAFFAHTMYKLPPIVAIAAGAVVGFVAGAVTERVLYARLRQRSQADWMLNAFLLSSGLSIVMRNGVQAIFGPRFKGIDAYWTGTVQLIPGVVGIGYDRLASFLIAMFAIVGLWLFLGRTRLGRAIRAVSQDEKGAQLMGINLSAIFTLTFAVGCMLAGLAGSSLATMNPAYPSVGIEPGIRAWYVMILAGMGNVGGAIPAGFMMGLIDTAGYYFLGGGWQQVLSVAFLVVVLALKPDGLFGSAMRR